MGAGQNHHCQACLWQNINPADISTNEMQDGAHFRRFRDSYMPHLSDVINTHLLAIHYICRRSSPEHVAPAAAPAMLMVHPSSYFSALEPSHFCRTITAISHLVCSTGPQLFQNLHGMVLSHHLIV
jgi:hypothetical protein